MQNNTINWWLIAPFSEKIRKCLDLNYQFNNWLKVKMMKYEVPFYRKCVKHFFNSEEAEAFIIQCYFDGNKHISTIYDEGYTVYYYDVVPKRRIKQMTVQEIIVKNNIGDFSLTFTNVLGIRIENPNPNIIADMTVKSVEIDWVSQSAKISVVTR